MNKNITNETNPKSPSGDLGVNISNKTNSNSSPSGRSGGAVIINSPNAPAAIGPYSQAVEANGTLYVSGQLPVNPEVGKIDVTDITAQTERVFKNIQAILEEAGYTFENVVKHTVFLSDISYFGAMNEVYKTIYQANCPARSAFAVKDLPLGALVEIETIAVKF